MCAKNCTSREKMIENNIVENWKVKKSKVSLISISLISFTLFHFGSIAQAQLKVNKSEKDKKKVTATSQKIKDGKNTKTKFKKRKYTDSFFASSMDQKEKSEKELNLVLAGLNALIPIEKSIDKKSDLLLSKAVTLLSLGKIYYLNNKLPSANEKKVTYLNRAMKAASDATNITTLKDPVKARALHVYGMSALYMENESKSVEYFEQAIKLDPNSNLSPRLSLFIGEYYFENEKFDLALPFYGQFFNRLTPEEKSQALYKSAWCFLTLKQYENAEKSFLKIVGKPWAGDYGVDAIRDLAQTVTAYKSESEIIQFGVQNLANSSTSVLSDFYTSCYLIFLRQSGNTERFVLYDEILRLEKRPEKRVALAIKKLTAHQKGYASLIVFKDLVEIESLMTQANLKPESDIFRTFGSDLEVELKKAISSYVDTIAKKLKTPEILTETEIATKLQKLLWYHVTWFPNSKSLPQTYILAMDNCSYLKDADCSLRIGRLILRQDILKNVWPRARVEVIVALETLTKRDPKFQNDFVIELKAYADTQHGMKEWIPFTKKLTSIYMNEKKFSEAEPYLTKIYDLEKNSENLYRKLFCLYNQNKFKDVVLHLNQMPKEGPSHLEIKSLIRESSLNLAKNYADQKDFNSYEKFLFQFLKLDPEPAKADLAKSDYIYKLIDRKEYDKVVSFFSKTQSEKKFNGALLKPMELLLIHLFALNRFSEAKLVLSNGSTFGQYKSFDYYWLRVLLSENEGLTNQEFKTLSVSAPNIRMGVLSLAAISNPNLVKDYFKVESPVDDKERMILMLSQQMIEGQKIVQLSASEINQLGKIANPDLLPVGQLKTEKLIKLIEYPQPNWSQERLAKVTPDAMERVKSVRKQLVKELKDQRIDVQKRLITNAINVEKKMAWFFDESPIPDGLTGAELSDYQSQIDGFAQDYYQQISEYQKMLASIIYKENEGTSSKLLVPKNLDKWKRSKSNIFSTVQAEISKGKYFRALNVLESLKDIGTVSGDDHYRWRSFAILNQFPHDFASSYLQDELLVYKQVAILNDWSKLVGVPLGVRGTASSSEKE